MQENQTEVAAVAAVEEQAPQLTDVQKLQAVQFINSPDPQKWEKLAKHYSYEGTQIIDWLRGRAEPMDGDENNEVVEAVAFFHLDAIQHVPADGAEILLPSVDEATAALCYIRLRKPLDMARGYIWANKTAFRLLETFPHQPGTRCLHHLNVIPECCTPTEFLVGFHHHDTTVLQ